MFVSALFASSSSPSPYNIRYLLLLVIIICLTFVQYINLLNRNENPTIKSPRRSLFTLDWGALDPPGGIQSFGPSASFRQPLLNSLNNPDGTTGNESVRVDLDLIIPSFTSPVEGNVSLTSSPNDALPLCPMIPPDLHGPFKVDVDVPKSMAEVELAFPDLMPGGRSKPTHCTARHRVAIIVPYRDREDHLRIFLFNIHKFLQKQQLDYGIFIVEEFGSGPFNRAMLLNVGVAEALKEHGYQCLIFHDVDLLPEDDRNLYTCPVQPRHMSVSIDKFQYRLPYDDIFGGVSAMTLDHFKAVNGFSNLFWGWGGEDDDMSNRLRQKKLYISRYPANIARYKMMKHGHDKANPERFKYLYSGAKRMSKDGFNSLQYKRVDFKLTRLYTWILVDLPHLKP